MGALARRYACTFVATLIAVSPVSAQVAAWDYVGGGFGGSEFHVKDEHASPMIYSAWGIAPVLQYLHAGEEHRQYAEASFFAAVLSSGPANFRTDNCGGGGDTHISARSHGPGTRTALSDSSSVGRSPPSSAGRITSISSSRRPGRSTTTTGRSFPWSSPRAGGHRATERRFRS